MAASNQKSELEETGEGLKLVRTSHSKNMCILWFSVQKIHPAFHHEGTHQNFSMEKWIHAIVYEVSRRHLSKLTSSTGNTEVLKISSCGRKKKKKKLKEPLRIECCTVHHCFFRLLKQVAHWRAMTSVEAFLTGVQLNQAINIHLRVVNQGIEVTYRWQNQRCATILSFESLYIKWSRALKKSIC